METESEFISLNYEVDDLYRMCAKHGVKIEAHDKVRIDDPVGAFPVHGVCGVWGGIATGIFGLSLPTVDGTELTRGGYIWVQCYSTLVIVAWAFVTMAVVFFALKAVGLLRVSPEEETTGLDISEHGMHAYPSDAVAGGAVS